MLLYELRAHYYYVFANVEQVVKRAEMCKIENDLECIPARRMCSVLYEEIPDIMCSVGTFVFVPFFLKRICKIIRRNIELVHKLSQKRISLNCHIIKAFCFEGSIKLPL